VNAQFLSSISSAITDATQRTFEVRSATPVAGGSINRALRLDNGDGTRYFLKLNDARHHAMFVAEAAALASIAATHTIRVPRTIAHGITHQHSYLVLEHLELSSHGNARLLGTQLAALHRSSAAHFGFAHDNFIGITPQPNGWKDDWIDFWREWRLGYQLRLAAENGYGATLLSMGERLLDELPAFFAGYAPRPALLHGDLWSGNHAFLADGPPALFDPASYYDDRECDLAMTELFGGYPADFYAGYQAAWPLHQGYRTRRDLYNLYHILNHANLFGGGYVRQAEQMLASLLRQIR
jgi:fructosamine-3-kinase